MFDTTRTENNNPEAALDRVFNDILATQAAGRAAYVAEIKLRVQNGSYRPNLMVVADRLLGDLGTTGK